MQWIVASILSKCPRPFTGAGFRFVDCAKATDKPIVSRKKAIDRILKVSPFFTMSFCSESLNCSNKRFSIKTALTEGQKRSQRKSEPNDRALRVQCFVIESFFLELSSTQRPCVAVWIAPAVQYSVDNHEIVYNPIPDYKREP